MDEDGVGSGPGAPPVAAAAASGGANGAGENDASGSPNNNSNNNNEDSGDNSSSTTNNERWTCDACGCNTNTATDRNCTVCGTANGSSLLRRAGYVRAGLLARSLGAVRSAGGGGGGGGRGFAAEAADFGLFVDGFDMMERGGGPFGRVGVEAGGGGSSSDEDVDMASSEAEDRAMAALGMELAGISGSTAAAAAAAVSGGRLLPSMAGGGGPGPSARSIVDAARAGLLTTARDVEPLEPEQLWQAASDNGSIYQPRWMNPSQIGGRMRTGNGIEVGDRNNQNIAYLPLGAGEGRALRALEAFPRSAPFASFSIPAASASGDSGPGAGPGSLQRRKRRIFGFRVAFQHPSREKGKNMGGCYLIGVTTTSFGAFSEKNALQASPFFWGIEDGGNKYQGSRHQGARDSLRRGNSSYAVELGVDEAPRNEDDVLFGSKQVITCVVDMEARTLTFWRDENGESTLLGTLVSNLPRGGQLYPVVVPYNAGSTVAITGMSGDPLPLLNSFATDWKQAQLEKDKRRREELLADRSVLVKKGAVTSAMQSVLRDIFSGYETRNHARIGNSVELSQIEASRLWYRCGIKLSTLMEILQTRDDKTVAFADFLQLLHRVIEDDEKRSSQATESSSVFQIGDRVELVEGYERFGDAINGPLLPGERGAIVELQQGPEGERQSIRVLHDSRRWWYQPQAIVGEKSGLADSPGIWFLKNILRSHGYDPRTMQLIVGEQVTASSWRIGDIVVPKKSARKLPREKISYPFEIESSVGRIVAESLSSSSMSTRGRFSGSVLVEFISRSFAEGASIQVGASLQEKDFALESRRLPCSKLIHSSALHGLDVEKSRRGGGGTATATSTRAATSSGVLMDLDDVSQSDDGQSDFICSGVQADLQTMALLDASAIERIIKECMKSSTSLNNLFEAGLPRFALEAMDHALLSLQHAENIDTVSRAMCGLGKLAILVAEVAFPDECGAKSDNMMLEDDDGQPSSRVSSSTNPFLRAYQSQHDARAATNGSDAVLAGSSSRGTDRISSHERRRMLLSLMNRAHRNEGAPFGDLFGRELPSLEADPETASLQFRSASGLRSSYGEADDHEMGYSDARLENHRPAESSSSDAASGSDPAEPTYLDVILRGRDEESVPSSGLAGNSLFLSSSIKAIVSMGILGNSSPWLNSLLDSLTKRNQRKHASRDSSILKGVSDEDGVPLLQVAISIGCSCDVIKSLIRYGALVGEGEIKLAAETNQPYVLSELLLHKVYVNATVDLESCSSEVSAVVSEAIQRQDMQRKSLREKADSFLVSFFAKLVELGLICRQQHQQSGTLCSRSIAAALVGNAELCALRKTRQKNNAASTTRGASIAEASSPILDPCGLMQILPISILGRSLVEKPSHLTTLLLLIEDFLCSKWTNDGCIGLRLLSTLLQRFPSFNLCPEMERYGFAELILSHDALALNHLAEISARVTNSSASSKNVPDLDTLLTTGAILCPKKHTAECFFTQHASFRCDLCGKGVERGEIMHGCRKCDWDACERCTDKAEGGIVKSKYVRELASICNELLSQDLSAAAAIENDETKEGKEWAKKMTKSLEHIGNSSDTNTLSIRLLQADPDALSELALMLSEQGRITIHQFLMVILPALHSTLMGKSVRSNPVGTGRSGSGRRSKKPRVAGMASSDYVQDFFHSNSNTIRFEFAKEMVKMLVDTSSTDQEIMAGNEKTESDQGVTGESQGGRAGGGGDDDDESEDDYDEQEKTQNSRKAGSKAPVLPEFMRRLHQVLALHETLDSVHSRAKDAGGSGHIQQLKKPVKLCLTNALAPQQSSEIILYVEPLVAVGTLCRQILLSSSVACGKYHAFCRKLVEDSTIILERPLDATVISECTWRVAKVVSYDERGGWHRIKYASGVAGLSSDSDCVDLRHDLGSRFVYETERVDLVLAARCWVVVHRGKDSSLKSPFDMEKLLAHDIVGEDDEKMRDAEMSKMIGSRVESDIVASQWRSYTVVSADIADDQELYTLVSDVGEIIHGVPVVRVRGIHSADKERTINLLEVDGRGPEGRNADMRGQLSRAIPFLAARRQASGGTVPNSVGASPRNSNVLKRTWSALSPIQSMQPVDICSNSRASRNENFCLSVRTSRWTCQLGGRTVNVLLDDYVIETPSLLKVTFNGVDPAQPVETTKDTTVVSLLDQLYGGSDFDIFDPNGHKLSFSVVAEPAKARKTQPKYEKVHATSLLGDAAASFDLDECIGSDSERSGCWPIMRNRVQQASVPSNGSEIGSIACDGLDEICMQVLDIMESLAEAQDSMTDTIGSKQVALNANSIFVNMSLSQKLKDQLDNPLNVVGGLIPDWCFFIPSLAPQVFSYDSRRLLMDCVAFGPSRSTLKQQETKINVDRLRQRMNSLRARAVELVGEAFSGGAEDPTALQLQADELYGMEEALAQKVRLAFRNENWQEQGLEVAKAVVARDVLISDAMNVMTQYASNKKLSHRRLEVRFVGESGFDAASGDEAGVTRGFYADVAEALLSCEVVAGVSVSLTCPPDLEASMDLTTTSCNANGLACKLPLWIPDIDTTGQVVLPTPRAGPTSAFGVFPRPISNRHPQHGDVLRTFRFIGQLFAAAMRDGFMFPLPLSASFLKLVQRRGSGKGAQRKGRILSSSDLPRPGFLGGEIAAVESTICQTLDSIDLSDPSMTGAERDRRYQLVASDKGFARVAFGKHYQCSFSEYFEDRTFVDPLDPSQGAGATALCHDGHNRSVTIHNVREWVALAKDFVLHDGVLGQASAFRAGVEDFFSAEFLSLFTAEELQIDVCGVGDNVDQWDETAIKRLFKLDGKGAAEAFIAVAAIGGNAEALSRRFGQSSPTIKYLVKTLLEATPKQRRQFLSFVTSVPIVTPGSIEVVPIVSPGGDFMPMRDPSCLPRANTCARKLYLPKFESYDSFSEVLWAVVREESKHKGFWEFTL